ncbi:MAG: phenylalanine--tRNA ligase subunit beta [Planctomycetota bacterium]
MLVSWKWLSRYVDITLAANALTDKMSLSGLNFEGSETVEDDLVIDLEVTSNRGDCLGHIGVAREIAVLTDQSLKAPNVEFQASGPDASESLSVQNEYPEACPQYTARVIRGVKVGTSPEWLQQSLRRVGIGVVNNVVDVTNYVMMECAQPLHAFDLAKVASGSIIVRPAKKDEAITAIDHREYLLPADACVIADADAAIAVAGVMGGASTEVSEATTDLVIEAADFVPLSVRRTARALKLHSPSSFRFERRVDPAGIDWASRRACQLITEIAGGHVAPGVLVTGGPAPDRAPIILRRSQMERLLGITIDANAIAKILRGLGCTEDGTEHWIPPTWRHDLTREVDLIEEVARVHGYDQIPENAPIPVTPSSTRPFDGLTQRVRHLLTASGFTEAMTPSVVTAKLDETVSPWTDREALQTRTPMLEGAKRLRRTLLPSLLQSRAFNWSSASITADLFEIAHVYLPPDDDADGLPSESYHLGIIGGDDFRATKGVVESLCQRIGIHETLGVTRFDCDGFAPGTAVQLQLPDGSTCGIMGLLSTSLCKQFKTPGPIVVAELSLDALQSVANLVPQQRPVSPYPSIKRDLNLVMPETVSWKQLAEIVTHAADSKLAELRYQETYRNAKQDGDGQKRVLFTVELQSKTETLSGADADHVIHDIVSRAGNQLDAKLLS